MNNLFKYEIRELVLGDLRVALQLVRNVFMKFEAPDYSDEGIKTFIDFIEIDSISKMFKEDILKFWGCFDNDKIIGVIAIRNPSHISMLFVDGRYHKQGIGRKLFKEALMTIKNNVAIDKITVNSSPYAVEVYHKLGFKDNNIEQTVDGIRFTPMQFNINRP